MKNWAGNYTYSTSTVHEATSVEEVRELVQKHDRLKVLGTRHCFNGIADSMNRFLSLAQMNRITGLDIARQTVTAEAGVRYGDLATWLHERGHALHNLASLPHISVVGGCITATHGSGVGNGNLATAVLAIEFMTADGEIVTLSSDREPDRFFGGVVNLGGLGVILRTTLAVEPAYSVHQTVYENLPLEELGDHFGEIMSAGYSVSLFTDWRQGQIDSIWVKGRAGQAPTAELFGARAADRNLHPIKDIGPEHCTEQRGVAGPWHERLPHFRMGFTPSSGEELQSEYFVPREHSFDAILAIARLSEEISPALLISEIRSIAEDELWMSPCYRQASTAIHFTWKPDWATVRGLLPLIEAQLAPFQARPHWGKLFDLPHARLRELYPKLPEFRELLLHYDPRGKFRNDYLDKLIFGK
ncbi:MAG: FAD-binding protein [Bacteroidota bacterium]|nr:FAD-binding protein [Bacteroidota bacterium]MDP4215018.1 FAD-binding protein [Bacteroidota bacterium]MDP4244234.1 FAD-binding protein [Bacteroidota bacterium]MDP4255951.1 FAD-binding protein [Bacteroidota bacterium]MDP4258894.1 FAD-binding protein [Bacteroidota bacterium]